VRVPIALTVAGSDSGGGAGIQADLKAFSALGAFGASVITALTAQNTREVREVNPVPLCHIRAQFETVLDDLAVDAVKTGMLDQPEVVREVAKMLEARGLRRLVVDPVMVSKGGAPLLQPAAVESLKEHLIPQALVLTPNLPEAAVLLGLDEADLLEDPQAACAELSKLGPRVVVLKGGHGTGGRSDDHVFDGQVYERLEAVRLDTLNTHGTGCTFSAAICARLAHGDEPLRAIRRAKAYLHEAIAGADDLGVGGGHGPVHHFHRWWKPRRD
jgi:hydroxymethylpyrimidine/phosphomethylpyrimidine kinase